MLKNPSFNGGTWRKTHTEQEFGEIVVPEEWTAWWKEGGLPIPWDPANTQGYRRPEMKVIDLVAPFLDPLRISDPPKAVQIFTFQGIHEAGLYQRVTGLEPGKILKATFAVHGWSSVLDDPRKSDFCDGGPYNMMFTIGIDRTGGTDPWGVSIDWGTPTGVYNVFEDVIVTGVVVPPSGTVTVFIRSQVRWRFKHNDAYIDNVRLEYISSTPPPPTPLPSAFPLTLVGSKVGIHSILPAETLDYVRKISLAGGHVPVVKAVSDLGWLKEVKAADASVITVGRFIGLPGDVDVEGPPLTGDLKQTAQKMWDIVWPEFKPHIAYTDYLEITNELDPVGPVGHALLAQLCKHLIPLAEAEGVKLAIFSYSMGVPEWAEWEAIVSTGIFQLAKAGGHVLALHEYASPAWKWFGQPIPGRPADPNHGPLMCRYRWLYEDLLIPAGLEIPLIITEANVENMSGMSQQDWLANITWYDLKLREDWYVLGATLFTLDGTNAWPQFNFGKYITALTYYAITQKQILNAVPPYIEPEPEIDKYPRTVHMADPTYMTPAQITQAYEKGRLLLQTVTPSWQDAIPLAEDRPAEWLTNTVNAGPLPIEDQNRYQLWVDSRDPSTILKFTNPLPSSYFEQRDPTWSGIHLGTSSYTMGGSGCLVTAVAEWMKQKVDPAMNPYVLVQWLNANGGFTTGGNLIFNKPPEIPWLPKKFKFKDLWRGTTVTTYEHVKQLMLTNSAPVIIQVDFYSDSDLDSHFVLVTEVVENDLLIADPWTGKQESLMAKYGKATVDDSIFAILVYSLVEDVIEVPLLGFNDPNDEGAYNFLTSVAGPSLVVIPVFIGDNPTPTPMHFANSDIRVIVNIRYSWSTDMGGGGTLPGRQSELDNFVKGATYLIENSSGVWGWSVSNEANNPRESPATKTLTPSDVANVYNAIRRGIAGFVRMAIGGLDPFNAQLGDVAWWLSEIYNNVDDVEFVAVHGYIRGPDSSLVLSKEKFANAPLQWQSLNYVGCVMDLLEYLPVKYKDLPVYVTEFNHIWKTTEAEGKYGWVTDQRAAEVIAAAYGVALANGIAGLAIYRWMSDDWAVYNNNAVLNVVKQLIEETYNG